MHERVPGHVKQYLVTQTQFCTCIKIRTATMPIIDFTSAKHSAVGAQGQEYDAVSRLHHHHHHHPAAATADF